jgi:FkbM family methyltransferase
MKTKRALTKYGIFEVYEKDHIGKVMLSGKHYEHPFLEAIFKRVKNKRVAIDVGANIGTHTIPYGKHFQRVVAFEPNPPAFTLLRNNIEANNLTNVRAYQIALSDRSRTTSIANTYNGNLGAARIRKTEGDIKVKRLDEYNFKPTFIKIDVEGHEKEVIEGGREMIWKYKPVIFFESNNAECFGILIELGYSRMIKISKNYIAMP